jgi:hypothetical protein
MRHVHEFENLSSNIQGIFIERPVISSRWHPVFALQAQNPL